MAERPTSGVAAKPLPLANQLLFALGSMGSTAVFFSTTLWLVYFYAPPEEAGLPVLVPVLTISAVLALGRFIEAFDDPFIGHWSDITQSRWGRRVPFVVLGMPFMALFFYLLWTPPHGYESTLNAVYFFVALELFYFAATVVLGPYEAMLPEIATTARERVSLSSWKVVFGSLGTAVALVGSPLVVYEFGFPAMALVVITTAWLTIYVGLFGSRKYLRYEQRPSSFSFPNAVKSTFSNRPFLAFSAGFVLFYLGFNLMIQVTPFFVRVVLEETENKVSWITGAILVVVLLSLPLMARLATSRGKKWTYAAGMLVLVLYMPFWFFVGYLPVLPKLVQGVLYVALSGVPFAALHVFPTALMADVIDYDEQLTGQRREAIYYGIQETLKKLAFALSTGLFALVLSLGYSAENPLGIRLMGPIASLVVLLGFLAFVWGYHLPDTIQREEPRVDELTSNA